jgi:2-polyprenyl-6-methoxyphenol hydroxylase-like FAD-dependent oxidoreductase
MAMEDAWVLAEALRSASSVDSALADYVRRRTARVTWVQQQSLEAAESLCLSPRAQHGHGRRHAVQSDRRGAADRPYRPVFTDRTAHRR